MSRDSLRSATWLSAFGLEALRPGGAGGREQSLRTA